MGDHNQLPDQPEGREAIPPGEGVSDAEILAHEHAATPQEPDVREIHRPIFREQHEPAEGREPAPWWLWAVAALALFAGGWYLGRHGGTFNTGTHLTYPAPEEFVARQAQTQAEQATADPVRAGQTVYTQRCQSCHQQNGRGVPDVFPPIIDAEWETGPPETVVRILLHGIEGPIEVAGALYNGVMPAWRDQLTDAEIAAVATFIRQWETNDAGAVTPELVARLRAETVNRTSPWTAEELRDAERR